MGFSDIITPEPIAITYPTILAQPAPELRAYNRETVIAEKFEAMLSLGEKGSADSLNAVAPLEHINCFNHQVLVRLAERAGLRVVTLPDRHATSLTDAARDMIKPFYYKLRRRGGSAIHATV